jgi:hypothetical protein
VQAFRTKNYGLPAGRGWQAEPAGSLERMAYLLSVYEAFKAFEERGDVTEVEFSRRSFELWQIMIDVEKLEKELDQHGG